MKSLIKKQDQKKLDKAKKVQGKGVAKIEASAQTTRTEAQCCAKVSRTAVGCHD